MKTIPLLNEEQIECRVKKLNDKGAVVLLYKTARTDMDILDQVFGVENWTCDYKEIKNNMYCGIGARADGGVFVWKWDCGIESREDEDGNQKKGEASDAFKRAGFKWGIGRELYTAPVIFIPIHKLEISETRGRKSVKTTMIIEKIAYDEARRISGLSIVDAESRKRLFVWQRQAN